MVNNIVSTQANASSANLLLSWSGRTWLLTAVVGQICFIIFIAGFYGLRVLSGDFAAWNDSSLIHGYIEGDATGNFMFAVHVLLAAAMTLLGIVQLIPRIRSHLPVLHRASGRLFLLMACLLAVGGLWMTWVRGTYLHISGAFAVSIDAVLILTFATLTMKHAIRRNITIHQRWAMRLFIAANAVWFLRVSMMAWVIIAQGPVGMNKEMSGPANIVIMFGCYLIPLTVYELYRVAGAISLAWVKVATASLVFVAAGFTALGVFGTVTFMWLPNLWS